MSLVSEASGRSLRALTEGIEVGPSSARAIKAFDWIDGTNRSSDATRYG
jgi:hypothetical protein